MINIVGVLAISFLPFFESRNEIALYIINPPTNTSSSAKIERPELITIDKCPGCDGAGKLKLEEPDFGQNKGRIGGKGRRINKECPLCRGGGKIKSFINPANVAMQLSNDYNTFSSRHQSKGDIAVGNAYIPHDAYEKLDKKKLKLIENAYGNPCKTCKWTGIEACKKCDGEGIVKCTESDCKDGWTVTEKTSSYTRTSSGGSFGGYGNRSRSSGNRRVSVKETKIVVNVCTTCGGTDFVRCPACMGMRAHPCKRCGGTGMKSKAGGL